ncbi:c-type cytochrome [Sulfurivermis fontis]|uniref:c-type cytochrome n=1 Tax=Sulfurivermis fontis TaxID=1972068 RepID=UPI000FDACC7C|nr:cytochrome c [Sulfurivermis fontis]
MIRTFLKVFVFMLVVVSLYAYVGQLVPQFEELPPKKRIITPDTPPDELVAIGQELLRGKGGCLICHKDQETGNERGPDLRQAAAKAPTRKPGTGTEEYLLEALLHPDAFLVPGYPKMMPAATTPPANLSIAEVKAVIGYLQSLSGGEPTLKVLPEDVKAEVAKGPVHRGRELMNTHGCVGCHTVEGEGGAVGPDLTQVAARHAPAEIALKIADPARWTAEGFPAGVMPPGAHIPEGDRQEIAAYLAGLAGQEYSPTGAASPWSHEGVRLGLVIAVFNVLMLLALAWARRHERKEAV